jgi:formate-dependent nitrite reductase cytochrome c552 subunit
MSWRWNHKLPAKEGICSCKGRQKLYRTKGDGRMSKRHVILLVLAAAMVFGLGLTALAGPDEDFAGSAHSALNDETKAAAARGSCLLCHDGKGLIPGGRVAGKDITDPEPMTCDTCHDWGGSENPSSLRKFGESKLAGAPLTVVNGKSAMCTTCHNARKAADDKSVAAASVPHRGPQGEMVAGVGGFEFPGPKYANSPHTTIENSCVTCHMADPVEGGEGKVGGHTFKVVAGEIENTNACVECHPKTETVNRPAYGDFDGDTKLEGIQSEVAGLVELLQKAISERIDGSKGSFAESHGALVFVDRNGKEMDKKTYDPTLLKAAWNMIFVENDGSEGVHNPVYAVQLLQASYKAVSGTDVPNAKLR